MQECAQLLAGDQLPLVLIGSLLDKASIPESEKTILCINVTPYDGWLEKTLMRWNKYGTNSKNSFKTLSVSKSLSTAQFVEKMIAVELMEDYQLFEKTFSNVVQLENSTSTPNRPI